MRTILIAEDDPLGRELLVTLLGYAGHRVVQARDGAEALALTRQERPDLVIADVLMPIMDGYELVRRLRADDQVASTPVVFYTASYHEREARLLAAQCGVMHVLTKPTEPELLLALVSRVLNEQPPIAGQLPIDFEQHHLRLVSDRLVRSALEVETLNARLAGLVELGLRLAAEEDPAGLLDTACRGARELLGAHSAVVELTDPDEQLAGTTDGELPTPAHFGHASIDEPGSAAPLRAPLTSPSHAYGWIVVQDKLGGGDFSTDDRNLLRLLAAQLALAYENAQRARSLAAAVRARDEFLSIAAHELKTPVTSMVAYTQLLLVEWTRGPPTDPERTDRALRTIEKQSLKLRRLISQLMDIASLDAGKLHVQSVLLDLCAIVQTSVAALDMDLHQVVQSLPPRAMVVGDPARLVQVVTNVLLNAQRYGPAGSAIEIEIGVPDDVEVSIRDHGPGIAIERRDHIFDRFFQAHADSHASGMGLGLCICRKLLELQAGRIRVEFPSDGGTRFVVSLPNPHQSQSLAGMGV